MLYELRAKVRAKVARKEKLKRIEKSERLTTKKLKVTDLKPTKEETSPDWFS